MPLEAGRQLGPYEILSPIGAGGMGEVYKARDTRLDRTVAIKVLPEHVASDPDLKQRFEREAKTISSLNHPHICTLHDIGSQDGIDFLVMEYLEGETLAQRLEKGALPLDQALKIAIEIADALDKAHRQGITHRDLKPGNIMLTKAGAKLLDFGLAKLRKPGTVGAEGFSAATTESGPLTGEGKILGTLQYMAPEQLEGEEADARTDIFAFGAVVYEMATGKKAFTGNSQASLIAAILDSQPPAVSTLQPLTPPTLDRVVNKCLAKDPEDRWHSVHDLTDALEWIGQDTTQRTVSTPGVASPTRERRVLTRQGLAWSLAGAGFVAIVVFGLASWLSSRLDTSTAVRRLIIQTERELVSFGNSIALSPDGQQLVYVARSEGVSQLYVRRMDQLDAVPIRGTEGARAPFFSPDGQSVGFVSGSTLRKVPTAGGQPMTVCDVQRFAGADWGPDDRIVFGTIGSGLFRVAASGGVPQPITTLGEDEYAHLSPLVLPGAEAALFVVLGSANASHIAVVSLETAEHRTLVEGGDPRYNGVKYAYSGHLVLTQDQSLWAVPFDARALEVTGDPVLVQEGVRVSNNRVTQFAIADEGSLVYIPEDFSFTGMPVWVDRTGTVVESFMEEALDTPRYPRLSPDGRRLALVVGPFDAGNIWVQDLTGRPPIKLTFEGNDFSPLWTPDGQQLVFESERTEQGSGMYVTPIDGSMADTQRLPVEGHSHPFAFTPDGRELLFVTFNDQRAGSDIWALSMNGNPESRPVVQTEHREGADGASVSSDGRWLAYVSRVTGRSEVWVRPYLEPGAPVRISPDGGIEPIWGRDDREIVYVENLAGPKMMAVAVETEPEFRFEPPARLFEWAAPPEVQPPSYDVGPDGNFLMIRREQDATVLNRIIVVQNWFDELQRLVPSP